MFGKGQGYISMTEHLPSMHKNLGSISKIAKNKNQENNFACFLIIDSNNLHRIYIEL
jgi:hypothetical protein